MTSRGAVVSYLVTVLTSRDAVVSNLVTVVTSRDAVVSSRDAGVSSRDAGVSSRVSGVSSRDSGVTSRDAGVTSRDAGVSSRDAGVSSRDAGVSSRDAGVSNLVTGVSSLVTGASNLVTGVSSRVPVASNLVAVASNLVAVGHVGGALRASVPRVKGCLAGVWLLAGVCACAPSPPAPESAHPRRRRAPPLPLLLPSRPPPALPARSSTAAPSPTRSSRSTWDDGPDTGTLALAQYLHAQGVSATFFVVAESIDGLSDEPGRGRGVFETGHEHLPILGDLVGLGHRVENHTLNHVLLDAAPASRVVEQLRENQARIDPFVTGGLRLFRAPGGAWNAAASAAVDGDPSLARLVGPVRWDVDGKDWEGSLYCRSERPAVECERAAPGGGLRVKPEVVARRYLSAIDAAGHGIVLLHDRVGHVGSGYALAVAEALIPALVSRGYVFAAPVLRFSPLAPRAAEGEPWAKEWFGHTEMEPSNVRMADVDGDGRVDFCGRSKDGIFCGRMTERGLDPMKKWSRGDDFGDAAGWANDVGYYDTIRYGDVNGDGRADVCGRSREGVVCALSDGQRFLKATLWQPEMSDAAGWRPVERSGTMEPWTWTETGARTCARRGRRGGCAGWRREAPQEPGVWGRLRPHRDEDQPIRVPPTVMRSILMVGHPTPDGHALPVLAAGPDPVADLQVVAQHGDVAQHLGAVADEVHALERRGQLAVLDEVALRQGEDEVAVGDVDLAAAEALGVDAALDALHDLLRIVRAGEEDGVGHARHRRGGEALAPAVAGRL